MDAERFDRLARALVTRRDRRRVLQGVSGGMAALLGSILGRGLTEAAPKANCTQPGQTKCRGQCVFTAEDRNNCGACASVCPESRHCCAGSCTNLQTDAGNCGLCGKVCRVDQTIVGSDGVRCIGGACVQCSDDSPGPLTPACCNPLKEPCIAHTGETTCVDIGFTC